MAGVSPLSRLAAVACVLAIPLTGCARLHARSIGPALDTPAPPPRVVPTATAPIDSQPILASPPVGEVQTPAPAVIRPQDTRAPAPAPAPAATGAERPPAPAPDLPPPLQTTANPVAAEQHTRASLASATRDLGRIDVRALSADAKAQYDIARGFVAQATNALNAKNYEFAQQLADKAATLAALLQNR
jgi:hypothetical protein